MPQTNGGGENNSVMGLTAGDMRPEVPLLTDADFEIPGRESSVGEGIANEWEVILVDPELTTAGPNIRETNWEHVKQLARSILQEGQLQECVGEVLADGAIRIWAGQHRRLAMIMLNRWRSTKSKLGIPIRVRVYGRAFTPDQIFAIQLAENLHNQMTPAEEAKAIGDLWQVYVGLYGEEDATVAELARRIGRGSDKVGDALRFCRLVPEIQTMVHDGVLVYSHAIELSRVPHEQQLPLAVKIITHHLDLVGIREWIRFYVGAGVHVDQAPLLSVQMVTELVEQGDVISFRKAAGEMGMAAALYFQRVLYLIRMLDDPTKVHMTRTVQGILCDLIDAADSFREMLSQYAPDAMRQLEDGAAARHRKHGG